jgi:hypothetical protein
VLQYTYFALVLISCACVSAGVQWHKGVCACCIQKTNAVHGEVYKDDAVVVYHTASLYNGRVNLNVKALVILAAVVSVAVTSVLSGPYPHTVRHSSSELTNFYHASGGLPCRIFCWSFDGSSDGPHSIGSPMPLLTCVPVPCFLLQISVTPGYTLQRSLGDPCYTVAHYGHQRCGVTTAHTADYNRTPFGYPVSTSDTAFMVSWFPVSGLCYGLSDFCAFACTVDKLILNNVVANISRTE